MSVQRYKLLGPNRTVYLAGYAEEIECSGGRILIKGRRVSVAEADGDELRVREVCLPDLQLPAEDRSGWSVWASKVPRPNWWLQGSQSPMPGL